MGIRKRSLPLGQWIIDNRVDRVIDDPSSNRLFLHQKLVACAAEEMWPSIPPDAADLDTARQRLGAHQPLAQQRSSIEVGDARRSKLWRIGSDFLEDLLIDGVDVPFKRKRVFCTQHALSALRRASRSAPRIWSRRFSIAGGRRRRCGQWRIGNRQLTRSTSCGRHAALTAAEKQESGETNGASFPLLVQTAQNAAPAPIEADLPAAIRSELVAMAHLSDEVLWSIGYSTANADKIALHDVLLERHRSGTITPEGADMLRQLREDLDALMLRKAQAFGLLKSRGHTLPALEALPVPAAWVLRRKRWNSRL